jgi:hypothetical protein
MSSFLSMKAVRLLLAFSVSIWMAGGCLFGCSSSAMGAEGSIAAEHSANAIIAAESCHAASSHDCCSTKKPKKQTVNNSKQPKGVPSFAPGPRGMMKDCPLVVNATAATSKNSGNLPDPGRGPIVLLPLIENKAAHSETFFVTSIPPNRGPTYLRCCVLLI